LLNKIRLEGEKYPGKWCSSVVMENKPRLFDKFLNETNLISFRRTPLALGEQNWPDRPKNHSEPWLKCIPLKEKIYGGFYLCKMLLKTRLHFINKSKFILEHYKDNKVGNPCYYRIPFIGTFTEASIRQGYYIDRIIYLLKKYGYKEELCNVFEIGGGFAGLCGKFMTVLRPKRYILTDLPEDMFLSLYYLSKFFQNVSLIYLQEDLIKLEQPGIFIIAPWLLEKLNIKMDLAINTMSFQHMTLGNIKYYFDIIYRHKTKFIYFVNRNAKRDPTDVIVDDYPIPKSYSLLHRGKYLFSDHLECFYKVKFKKVKISLPLPNPVERNAP